MDISGCAAIVTGGASGMGLATAKMLHAAGASSVALLDINMDEAKAHAQAINGIAVHCDVTDEKSVKAAMKAADDYQGPARICINCAGIVHGRRMINKEGLMPLDDFRRVIEVNLLGTYNVMSQSAAKMINLPLIGEERGIIINTASIAAFEGQIGQTAYSASKGGVVSLTLPSARELASFGIRVMTIAPGLIDTPMFAKISPEAREALSAMVPFPKRLGKPEEYAALAKSIIENSLLNGETIRLDGALRMQAK